MLSHLDVFYILNQGGLLSGWSLMRMVSHQCGLSVGFLFLFFIFYQGGL